MRLLKESYIKLFSIIGAVLLLAVTILPVVNVSAQEQSYDFSNIEVNILGEEKYNELVSQNDYLSQKIDQLEAEGYNISDKVREVEGNYVVTYSDDSESTIGMIQLSKNELNSTLEFSINNDESLEYLKFEEEGKSPITLNQDEIQYTQPTIENQKSQDNLVTTYAVSDSTKSKVCSIVMSLSSLATGTVYGAVASGIGVPYAVAVAIVNAIGWGYLSSYC